MSKIFINGALGLAINDNRQVFLTQRNEPTDPNFHQKWNIPGGGIEWGETPEETLVREFREELNIVPTIIYPHPITITSIQGDAHILLLCYIVKIGNQQIDTTVDTAHENMAYGWFSVEEANKLDSLPQTRETIAKAFALLENHDILDKIK
ncbi:MAG: NUDIX domain-containing protein [Microgenomates group bacterium]